MENSVTLDLKTYTDLIRENELLKTTLKGFKKAFESELEDYLDNHDYTLSNMRDKARLQAIVEEKDDEKVLERASVYTSGIKTIANKYEGAFTFTDACAYVADSVRVIAGDKLSDMEESQQ